MSGDASLAWMRSAKARVTRYPAMAAREGVELSLFVQLTLSVCCHTTRRRVDIFQRYKVLKHQIMDQHARHFQIGVGCYGAVWILVEQGHHILSDVFRPFYAAPDNW